MKYLKLLDGYMWIKSPFRSGVRRGDEDGDSSRHFIVVLIWNFFLQITS